MERLVSVSRAVRLLILDFAYAIDDRIDRFLSLSRICIPLCWRSRRYGRPLLKMQELADDEPTYENERSIASKRRLDEEDAKFLRKLFVG